MKRFFILSCLFCCVVLKAWSGEPVRYSIDGLSIKGQGDSLCVSLKWSFSGGRIDDNDALVIVPSMKSQIGEALLSPVVLYGRKSFYGKEYASGHKFEKSLLYEGLKVSLQCDDLFKYESWMDTLRLSLSVYEWNRKDGLFLVSLSQRGWYAKPKCPEEPVFSWQVKEPSRGHALPKEVEYSCPLFFDYESTKFDINAGDNLEDIGGLIADIKKLSSLSGVKLKSASFSVSLPPEADAVGVLKRSKQCAQSAFAYMQRAGAFRSCTPKVVGIGEDWDGVREWISKSRYCDDERVKSILLMDASDNSVARTLSREKPALWEDLLSECFPHLGKGIFRAAVEIPSFISPNFIIPYYEACPEVLSPHDFFFLSKIYDEYSDDWLEVISTGAELNPSCQELQLDAAMGYVMAGQPKAAVPYLRNIGDDDDAKFVYAWWLFKMGRFGEALDIIDVLRGRNSSFGGIYAMSKPYMEWMSNRVDWKLLYR